MQSSTVDRRVPSLVQSVASFPKLIFLVEREVKVTPGRQIDPPATSVIPPFRPELAFPELSSNMLARIATYGHKEHHGAHEFLWTRGQRDVDLFVVLSGAVEVVAQDDREPQRSLVRFGPGQFSGELDLLSSRRTLVDGCTLTECELLRIPRSNLRRLMKSEGDIANLILQAAIWRRLGILKLATANIALIGEHTSQILCSSKRFSQEMGILTD